ncbi:MAG: amidohydrolase [Firmicutes bacterium]|nr:amidohydrolase [Bacillota bacterium]
MRILFKNLLLAGSNQRTDLAVVDNRFAPLEPEHTYDRVLDCSRHLALAGFINTHGHAAMTLLRGVGSDLPLQEWLEQWMWPLEAKLTEDDVYWGTMLAILEMLKSGTTTFTDMYFFEDAVARAVEESGIRAVLSRGLVGLGPDTLKKFDESVEFARTWHGAANGRITTMLGPHAPYTNTPESLGQVIAAARDLKLPLQIHLCETRKEVEDSLADYGKTPVEYVHDLGLFEVPVLAAHCVHVSERDIQLLADYDVRVAHNPGSNLKLGSGIAPLPALLAKGITVGLGTDGAASNNNLDMLRELRLAALLHKGTAEDPTLISADTALAMATEHGARALFLDSLGKLEPGMKADMTLIDMDRPHLVPDSDPVAAVVYAAQASDVDLVMVDGKILVENGEVLSIDEEKILHEARRCARRLGGE